MASSLESHEVFGLPLVTAAPLLLPLTLLVAWTLHRWLYFRSHLLDVDGKPIPGPKADLIGGNLRHFVRSKDGQKFSAGMLHALDEAKSDTICWQLPVGKPMIVTRDAELTKAVLTSNHLKMPKAWVYRSIEGVLGKGLVTANGDMWKAHRLMINPVFRADNLRVMMTYFVKHAKAQVAVFNKQINEATEARRQHSAVETGGHVPTYADADLSPEDRDRLARKDAEDYQEQLRKDYSVGHFAGVCCHASNEGVELNPLGPNYAELDFHTSMNGVTLDIILDTGFSFEGNYKNGVGEDVEHAINFLLSQTEFRMKYPIDILYKLPTIGNFQFMRQKDKLSNIFRPIVTKRKQQRANGITNRTEGRKEDLLDLMLEANELTQAGKMPQTTKQYPLDTKVLVDQMFTLLGAGHETTSTLLTWTIVELGHHPEVLQKLREEVDRELGGRYPSYDDLKKCEYVWCVLQEVMRLCPPIGVFARDCEEELEAGGRRYPAGLTYTLCNYAVHRNPKYWERPDDFYPDRFLKSYKGKKHTAFTFFPFSQGPRHCVGARFAQLSSSVLLCSIIQNFDFRLVKKGPVDFVDSITRRPTPGAVKVYMSKRVHPPAAPAAAPGPAAAPAPTSA